MSELKVITEEAVPAALERAMRYRLLNDPMTAQSICEDILKIDPENEGAITLLLLAMTDQLNVDYAGSMSRIKEVLTLFKDSYERLYYTGIVCERQAKSRLEKIFPGSEFAAYGLLRSAMEWYEKAEAIRPAGNDESILHWNTCSRIIERKKLVAAPKDDFTPLLE